MARYYTLRHGDCHETLIARFVPASHLNQRVPRRPERWAALGTGSPQCQEKRHAARPAAWTKVPCGRSPWAHACGTPRPNGTCASSSSPTLSPRRKPQLICAPPSPSRRGRNAWLRSEPPNPVVENGTHEELFMCYRWNSAANAPILQDSVSQARGNPTRVVSLARSVLRFIPPFRPLTASDARSS